MCRRNARQRTPVFTRDIPLFFLYVWKKVFLPLVYGYLCAGSGFIVWYRCYARAVVLLCGIAAVICVCSTSAWIAVSTDRRPTGSSIARTFRTWRSAGGGHRWVYKLMLLNIVFTAWPSIMRAGSTGLYVTLIQGTWLDRNTGAISSRVYVWCKCFEGIASKQ